MTLVPVQVAIEQRIQAWSAFQAYAPQRSNRKDNMLTRAIAAVDEYLLALPQPITDSDVQRLTLAASARALLREVARP